MSIKEKIVLLKSEVVFVISSILILATAIYIQTFFYANQDATWLMHCGMLILQGGHYYQDFFETNPPLILLIYLPALFMAKYFAIANYLALQFYLYMIFLMIYSICCYLLTRILPEKIFRQGVCLVLLFCFLILPLYSFSEREQLAVIFTCPYFLLVVMHSQKKNLNRWGAFFIAILAAIGFSLKPYFLLPLVLVEVYLAVKRKNLSICFRLETFVILLVMLGYVATSIIFFPDYFNKVLPLVWILYPPQSYPVTRLLLQYYALCTLASFALISWRLSDSSYENLYWVLMLSAVGFFGAYLWQGILWYYHIYPVFFLLMVALSMICFEWIRDTIKQKNAWNSLMRSIQGFSALMLIITITVSAIHVGLFYLQQKQDRGSETAQLVHFVKNLEGEPNILIFSSNFIQETIRYNTQAVMVTRFPSMLLIPGIERLYLAKSRLYTPMSEQFFKILMQDVKDRKPQYIVINDDGFTLYLQGKNVNFQFQPFLISNQNFNHFFQQYHWQSKVGSFDVYKLAS